jgi:hypothetical protein
MPTSLQDQVPGWDETVNRFEETVGDEKQRTHDRTSTHQADQVCYADRDDRKSSNRDFGCFLVPTQSEIDLKAKARKTIPLDAIPKILISQGA